MLLTAKFVVCLCLSVWTCHRRCMLQVAPLVLASADASSAVNPTIAVMCHAATKEVRKMVA